MIQIQIEIQIQRVHGFAAAGFTGADEEASLVQEYVTRRLAKCCLYQRVIGQGLELKLIWICQVAVAVIALQLI